MQQIFFSKSLPERVQYFLLVCPPRREYRRRHIFACAKYFSNFWQSWLNLIPIHEIRWPQRKKLVRICTHACERPIVHHFLDAREHRLQLPEGKRIFAQNSSERLLDYSHRSLDETIPPRTAFRIELPSNSMLRQETSRMLVSLEIEQQLHFFGRSLKRRGVIREKPFHRRIAIVEPRHCEQEFVRGQIGHQLQANCP